MQRPQEAVQSDQPRVVNVFLVTAAQTVEEAKGYLVGQGNSNTLLHPDEAQALAETARRLKAYCQYHGLTVPVWMSSSSQAALLTTAAFSRIVSPAKGVQPRNEYRQLEPGEYEGWLKSHIRQVLPGFERSVQVKCPGGESLEELAARVRGTFFRDLFHHRTKFADYEAMVIGAHVPMAKVIKDIALTGGTTLSDTAWEHEITHGAAYHFQLQGLKLAIVMEAI